MAERTRRRRSPCACACGGCAGLLLVGAIVFAISFAMVGNYQPRIAPPPLLPTPNGYDDYVAAGQMLKAAGGTEGMYSKKPGQEGMPVLQLEEVVVSRSAAAIARMRLAFGKECRAPAPRSTAQAFPELATFRDLARLMAADADVREARGDYAGAFSDGIDTLEMGVDVPKGGALIHGLVGVACEAIAEASMPKVLDRVPTKDASRLSARLQRVLLGRQPFVETLRSERNYLLMGLTSIDTMQGGLFDATRSYSDGGDGGTSSETPDAVKNSAGRIGWRFVRDRTIREVEDYMDRQLAEAQKPAWQRKNVPEPKWALAAMFVPVFSQAGTRFDEADTRARLLCLMLAIRAYQGQHGRLPASLADVGVDPRLTVDPYSGKSLIYKPKGTDYLLYSVGQDFTDDGGVPANEKDELANRKGDMGVRAFRYDRNYSGSASRRTYRRVPHMLPPKLPPGAPPLNP